MYSLLLTFVPATLCLIAAAFAGAVAIGARRFSDVATVTVSLGLLELTWLVKLLLVVGWFRPFGAFAGAVVVLAATLALGAAVPASRARLLAASDRLRGWRPRRDRTAGRVRVRDPFTLTAVLLLTVTVLVYVRSLVLALRLPPRDIDSLWYHLVAVAAWVRTGEMAPAIDNLSKAGDLGWTIAAETYPRDTETVSAWLSVFTHDTTLAGLTQYPFLVLLFLSTYGICRRFKATRALALSAAAIVVLAPTVVSQSYMAYNDIARAGVAVAVWHVLLMAYPVAGDRVRGLSPRSALVLTGALLGLGMGVKAANGYLIPMALISGLVLRLASDPATRPGKIAGMAWILGPTVLLGSFWYIRTWINWGSPTWPIAVGPFEGPKTMDFLLEQARPAEWEGEPTPFVMVRSWWSAVGRMGDRHWYVEWTGQLGLIWLLVLLPAVALLAVMAIVRRKHTRATFGVVLPLALGTLAAPGGWYSRYTMPILAAGALAFVLLVRSVADRLPARSTAFLVPVMSAVVAVVTCASLVGQMRYSTFDSFEDPKQRDYKSLADLLGKSERERSLEGVWGMYRKVDQLPPGTRIAFCAEDTPQLWIPLVLIGRDYDRVLVDLGECRTPSRVPVLMKRLGAEYLYTMPNSPIGSAVRRTTGETGLSLMPIVREGSLGARQLQMFTLRPVPPVTTGAAPTAAGPP